MRNVVRAILTTALITPILPSSATADVIFDNLNNGVYQNGAFYFAENQRSGESYQTAQDFPLASDYRLDSITIPLATFDPNPNEVTITLYNSVNGLPGSVVETWDVV